VIGLHGAGENGEQFMRGGAWAEMSDRAGFVATIDATETIWAFFCVSPEMKREFRLDFEIAAPPERVWAVIRDVERWHEWTASITSVEILGGGPLAVGKKARVIQPKLPPAVWQVTELIEGRGFAWVSKGPFFAVTGRHEVAAQGAGSVATLSLGHEGLFGPLLARLTRDLTARYVAMEAEGLRERSEGRR
jgi:carbon monoxide dehydrogenase subunit G